MALCIGLAVPLTFLALCYLLNRGRDFKDYRQDVKVIDSKIELESTDSGTNVVVSGILTNGSSFAWWDLEIEVCYLDTQGKTIDFDRGDEGFYPLLENSERSFRVGLFSRKQIPDYARLRVHVTSARDPNASWLSGF
jgi:hypothetical protein